MRINSDADSEGFTGMLVGVVWGRCCLIPVKYLDFSGAFILLLGCMVPDVSRQAMSEVGFRTESLVFQFFFFSVKLG